MSNIEFAASSPGGEPKSAEAWREDFLLYDERPKRFCCIGSSCAIELEAVLVFRDDGEPLTRAPHFRKPKGQDHNDGCNYQKQKAELREIGGVQQTEIEGVVCELPLSVSLPTKRGTKAGATTRSKSAAADDGIDAAQKSERRTRRRGTYDASCLERICDAHHGVVIKAKLLQSERDWTSQEAREWRREVLKNSALRLYGRKTNYDRAFWYLYPKTRLMAVPCVYHGYAKVVRAQYGFKIVADSPVRWSESPGDCEFVVAVLLAGSDECQEMAAYERVQELLRVASRDQRAVFFYAYGTPKRREDQIGIKIDAASITQMVIHLKKKAEVSASEAA